jgi:uncharacterized protein YgiM (DUF1202 family)
MLGARLLFLPVYLLHAIIVLDAVGAGVAETKAVVAGAPKANVRAGAGIDHAIRATLNEGEQVGVGKLDGEWYEVTTSDGQTGYIHRSLLKFGGEAPSAQTPQSAVKNKNDKTAKASSRMVGTSPQVATGDTVKASKSKSSVVAASKESDAPASKSPSIVQMLEGREHDLMIGAVLAVVFFFIGWICGGSYYLRRDRRQRSKIRF